MGTSVEKIVVECQVGTDIERNMWVSHKVIRVVVSDFSTGIQRISHNPRVVIIPVFQIDSTALRIM